MGDDSHQKVVSIFERHHRGEAHHGHSEEGGELVISPDGFNYVTFKKPLAEEQRLLDIATQKNYIVKFIEHHKDGIREDHYHVPGEKLADFLASIPNRPGTLLSIDRFYPDLNA